MAILRNLTREPIAFDCASLGMSDHEVTTSVLDTKSGVRGLRQSLKSLPVSVSLSACASRKASLAEALADGSAVDVPDAALEDSEIKRLVAARSISITKGA